MVVAATVAVMPGRAPAHLPESRIGLPDFGAIGIQGLAGDLGDACEGGVGLGLDQQLGMHDAQQRELLAAQRRPGALQFALGRQPFEFGRCPLGEQLQHQSNHRRLRERPPAEHRDQTERAAAGIDERRAGAGAHAGESGVAGIQRIGPVGLQHRDPGEHQRPGRTVEGRRPVVRVIGAVACDRKQTAGFRLMAGDAGEAGIERDGEPAHEGLEVGETDVVGNRRRETVVRGGRRSLAQAGNHAGASAGRRGSAAGRSGRFRHPRLRPRPARTPGTKRAA